MSRGLPTVPFWVRWGVYELLVEDWPRWPHGLANAPSAPALGMSVCLVWWLPDCGRMFPRGLGAGSLHGTDLQGG